SLNGSGTYTHGSNVTVTATPAAGFRFVRWIEGGAEVSASSSFTFSIHADRKFEAVFISSDAAVLPEP
ncbi:MAG TPA: hypothetical protein VLH18_03855, partial [Candidatus Limnocylindrales bacterium]|nr:hypothetical protein [Candidatus Limnocylindrales bacterium]